MTKRIDLEELERRAVAHAPFCLPELPDLIAELRHKRRVFNHETCAEEVARCESEIAELRSFVVAADRCRDCGDMGFQHCDAHKHEARRLGLLEDDNG